MKGLIHTCTIQKRYRQRKVTYTGATGTVSVGQTVTGSTSGHTAIITRIFTGYFVVKDISDSFHTGETITTATFSATLGTQTDYSNEQGEPEYYWKNDQTSIPCKFYYGGKGASAELIQTGAIAIKPLFLMLQNTVTIEDFEYRIISTQPGFVGTFAITHFPKPSATGIHHYECVLKKVITP